MSDTEKLKLINKMIVHFWEMTDAENYRNDAFIILSAISTVVIFREETE